MAGRLGAEAAELDVAISMILVTGGTGTLGREVVRRVLDAGHEARITSRRAQPAGESTPYGWTTTDLRTGEGTDAAVANVDTIIHCATSVRGGDLAAARNLVQAAQRAGGPHLVYISIVGVDRVPLGYYRTKLAVERVIEESGLPWTILRTTQFHDLVVGASAALARLPIVPVPADASFQPIDVRAVADRLVELGTGAPAGRVTDMGGPEVRAASDLMRTYLRSTGRRRVVRPVRLPGRVARGYRQGGHLAPDHAVGHGTFDEFLARRGSSGRDPSAGSAQPEQREW